MTAPSAGYIADPNVTVFRGALDLIVRRYEAGDTSRDEMTDKALAALRAALDWRCEHDWMHLGNVESDGEDCRHSVCFLCELDVPGWVS